MRLRQAGEGMQLYNSSFACLLPARMRLADPYAVDGGGVRRKVLRVGTYPSTYLLSSDLYSTAKYVQYILWCRTYTLHTPAIYISWSKKGRAGSTGRRGGSREADVGYSG